MKRWISILLIASLLLTFLPTGGAAQAETTATTHSHSGWKALSTVSSVGGTLSAGNYYLSSVTNTLSATGNVNIDGDVTLCLNGKVLDLRGYAINVGSGDHLTICDCSSAIHNGNIGDNGLWRASNSSGSCNFTGGVITSTSSQARTKSMALMMTTKRETLIWMPKKVSNIPERTIDRPDTVPMISLLGTRK